jgi:hypothetical protein
VIFEDLSKICRENSSFIKLLTRITGTLCKDQYTVLIISRSVLLQTKVVEKIKTHFEFSTFFTSENRVVCEIMWKNL